MTLGQKKKIVLSFNFLSFKRIQHILRILKPFFLKSFTDLQQFS